MSNKKGKHTKAKDKKQNGFVAFFGRLASGFMALTLPKKIISIALALIILVTVCFVGTLGFDIISILAKWNSENYQEIEDPDMMELVPINEKIVNIALFGIDTRAEAGDAAFVGNSDSIMILSLNTETGKIKLMSVMRDSYLPIVTQKDANGEIKTYNYKINAAYSGGGPERAIKTLNYNFGLDIKHYATVNFQGMADIIDAVGGIEIDVRDAEINAKNGLNHNIREQASIIGMSSKEVEKLLVKKAGPQKLKGIQAVAWARIRSVATSDGVSNDYGRTDRQRTVMEKLLNKALAMNPTEYPKVVKKVLPYMRTSVSPVYAASLATTVLTKKVTFEQSRLPHLQYLITDNAITTAGSSVYFDPTDAKAVIHAFIYDDIHPDEFLKTYTPIKANWAGVIIGNRPNTNPETPSDTPSDNPTTPPGEVTDPENPSTEPENPDGSNIEDPTIPPEEGEEPETPPETETDPTTPPEETTT